MYINGLNSLCLLCIVVFASKNTLCKLPHQDCVLQVYRVLCVDYYMRAQGVDECMTNVHYYYLNRRTGFLPLRYSHGCYALYYPARLLM